MTLPYVFFWDFTDEKHREVMRVLQERADKLKGEDETESVGAVVSVTESDTFSNTD